MGGGASLTERGLTVATFTMSCVCAGVAYYCVITIKLVFFPWLPLLQYFWLYDIYTGDYFLERVHVHRVGDHAGGTFAMKALKCQRPAICSAPQNAKRATHWAFQFSRESDTRCLDPTFTDIFTGNLAHAHAVCSTPSFPPRAGEHTLDLLDKYLRMRAVSTSLVCALLKCVSEECRLHYVHPRRCSALGAAVSHDTKSLHYTNAESPSKASLPAHPKWSREDLHDRLIFIR